MDCVKAGAVPDLEFLDRMLCLTSDASYLLLSP